MLKQKNHLIPSHPTLSSLSFQLHNNLRRKLNWTAGALSILIVAALLWQPYITTVVMWIGNPDTSVPALNSTEAKNQLVPVIAQASYLNSHVGADYAQPSPFTHDDIRALLQAWQSNRSSTEQQRALITLQQAPGSIVPILIDHLTDADATIRTSAAYALGMRHAPEASDALFFSTFDSDASVRAAAVTALGELNSLLALPRLQRLQIIESDPTLRTAANQAIQKIYAHIANDLNVASDLRAVAIAPANGRTYVATVSELYGPLERGWAALSRLPGETSALGTANDGQLVFLGTSDAGMFRSSDGGKTWQSINTGLPQSDFIVTAIAINPDDSKQIFITLAHQNDRGLVPFEPFGIFYSIDGGNNWMPLTRWKIDVATTGLALDTTPPGYLYGLTELGTWRYPLK